MEYLPTVLKYEKFWKNLSYEDIIELCLVNKDFNKICQDNNTWKYLLKRDYDVTYTGNDARQEYLIATKFLLDYLSTKYIVVTKGVLDFIRKFIPPVRYSLIDEITYADTQPVATLQDCIKMARRFRHSFTGIKDEDIELFLYELYPDLDEMIKIVSERGCEAYQEFATKPTVIYVNTIPKIIDYDYDLLQQLLIGNFYEYYGCEAFFGEVENVLWDL